MSESMIKQQVRSIAQSYGPFAARMWIVENLHDPESDRIRCTYEHGSLVSISTYVILRGEPKQPPLIFFCVCNLNLFSSNRWCLPYK